MKNGNEDFMKEAIQLSFNKMMEGKGGPFGAIVVKDGEIIGRGYNQVTSKNDPTAHAEIIAIREACKKIGSFQLEGCELYTSCEPCPMCLGAIYWARPDIVFYGNTKKDAAQIGFDDDFIYQELSIPPLERKIPMVQMLHKDALKAFQAWNEKEDKIQY
ncbi:nucleoside deaminase [Fulvivirgaceae bacterium BMA10]|uniref:Nucleoside deaminase n=1 Tax=Splendidivirga corallicola TaxID=3051826 RepID=A0ABT8KMA3_9BACT|nr:nucleoside deaminase [Fulvivirgaceae bacterium BMA10]